MVESFGSIRSLPFSLRDLNLASDNRSALVDMWGDVEHPAPNRALGVSFGFDVCSAFMAMTDNVSFLRQYCVVDVTCGADVSSIVFDTSDYVRFSGRHRASSGSFAVDASVLAALGLTAP